MSTGERIKALRREKGLSQVELAARAGIAVNSLRLYEAGKREPKVDAITKLAKALGVTKQELLGWSREPDELDETVLALYPGYDPSKETIQEYLARTKKAPQTAAAGSPGVSDDDIKFALFGGDGEITDEMFEEVKKFAAYLKMKQNQEN